MPLCFRSLVLLCMVAASLGTSMARAQVEPSPERWAVLVGVDDYQHATKLRFCGADVQGLYDSLTKTGFPARQVALLTDQAKDKKLLPFASNIRQQIERVVGYAEEGDLILIALSGHGVHLDGKSYFCPIDAQLEQPESLISLEWIYEKLAQSPANLRLVLVDACRNDPNPPGKRSLKPQDLQASRRQFVAGADQLPKGVMLIQSCSEGEFSQEDPEVKHGVFMHFVLEGLRGKADRNGDRVVTIDELAKYAGKETKLFVEERYQDSQRPKVFGNFETDATDFPLAAVTRTESRDTATEDLAAGKPKPRNPNPQGGPAFFGGVPDFLSEAPGFTLGGVSKGSPADKAGLKAGDRIIELDQQKVADVAGFAAALRQFSSGDMVEVVFMRGDQRMKVNVVLTSRP